MMRENSAARIYILLQYLEGIVVFPLSIHYLCGQTQKERTARRARPIVWVSSSIL